MIEQLHQQLIQPVAPPPISWWPPAPGWWVLALSLLLLLLLLPWLRRQGRRRRRRRVQQHMSLFSSIPPDLSDSRWLAEVNTRIKQLLKQRGEDSATRLFGEAWLDYLCSRYPRARRSALQPLAADLYRPQVQLGEERREALLHELRQWMRHDDV